MPSFRVVAYSSATLKQILVEKSHQQNDEVADKSHIDYFGDYLSEVGAQTIVVEDQYIDRAFLEDFAAYYVRCHTPYQRLCARIHFFSMKFDEEFLTRLIRGEETDTGPLSTGYRGFMVVKPLPNTIVGRTCLVTYPDTATRRRYFPVLQKYPVNLLGIDLEVRSLPFQEQDVEVAACASSALWSVLNGTAILFQHPIPSPVEITKAAVEHSGIDDRTLPNEHGLTPIQMADAIRSVGLEPYAIPATDLVVFRLAVTAYLRARIPCLLVAELMEGPLPGTSLGWHAVALNGFSFGQATPAPYGPTGCLFRATTVDRVYGHDDQVGPFARLRFNPDRTIGTSYPNGANGPLYFRPGNLLIPLYHKIRLPLTAVVERVVSLDHHLEQPRAANLLPFRERLVWDFSLVEGKAVKAEIFVSKLDPTARLALLDKSYPKYVWRADAHAEGVQRFSLLFDATDLLQGSHFLAAVPHDPASCYAIGLLHLASPDTEGTEIRGMLTWFGDNIPLFQ